MKKDGHIHTSFCPHGTNDSLEKYVERAISLGYQEISFTEHAPLPEGFTDPTPEQDSAMNLEALENYLEEIEKIKLLYRNELIINVGLEVDFIEGYEREIERFLNQYGPYLDDAILSVHFLKYEGLYDCVDYSPDSFAQMIKKYGSIEEIYRVYFQTVLQSVQCDLGAYKPKRIGHITLVKKFQRKFPVSSDFSKEISAILAAIRLKEYELDYNGAGLQKPLCREPYPSNDIAKEALKRGISLVYGSDAHQIKELGQGREQMLFNFIQQKLPTSISGEMNANKFSNSVESKVKKDV